MTIDFRVRPPFKSILEAFPGGTKRRAVQPLDSGTKPARRPALMRSHGISAARDTGSMALFIKEMDEAGIDIAVVMGRHVQQPPPDKKTPWTFSGMTRNRDIAEMLSTFPGRFSGFGAIDLANLERAMEELSLCKDLGLSGVVIEGPLASPPLRYNDPKLFPLYKQCERNGLMVSLTNSIMIGPDIDYSHPKYIQHVAHEFPDLRIVVPHACWPWAIESCAVAMQCPNIYLIPDMYLHLPHMPGRSIYVDGANSGLDNQILFASSYPAMPLADSVAACAALPFASEEIRNRVLHENASTLLDV